MQAQSTPASPPAPPECATDPALKALDFVLGDWIVKDSANADVGTNRLEKVAGGCAIAELWHDPDGTESRGLFYFLQKDRRWEMTLVTPTALMPGGLRQRRLVATLPSGALRFLGEVLVPSGVVLNRMTLTPMSKDRARETIELSRDGGSTWLVTFDAFYERRAGR